MPEASRRTIQLSPDDAALPEGLLLPPGNEGEVVVFLVDADVRPWAGPSLVRLARGWSERGRRALLVEADFTDPFLEGVLQGQGLQGQGGEGVADALLYGASPEHVRVPVEGGTFHFSPAGTVVPDPAEAWRHPGWGAFLSSVRAEGMVVLLALPADREVARELTALADRVFHMRGTLPGSDAPWPVIHPPGAAPVAPGGASTPVESPAHPVGVGPAGRDPEGAGAPGPGGTPEGEGEATLAGVSAAPVGKGKGKEGGGRGRVLLLVLVLFLLVLALLGAAWFGFIEIPGLALPGA